MRMTSVLPLFVSMAVFTGRVHCARESSSTMALSLAIFSSVFIWFFQVSRAILSTFCTDHRVFILHHSWPMRDQVTLPMNTMARMERSIRAIRIDWFGRLGIYKVISDDETLINV